MMDVTTKNSKLLVTGGAGFIGANFVNFWLKKYPRDSVVVLDALTYAGNKATLETALRNKNCSFVHGNIGDAALLIDLLRTHKIDTLVNFAAESHVDRSIAAPDIFIETNILGTYQLLKAAKQVWLDEGMALDAHRFHQVSTDEVYGALSLDAAPFVENTAYDPRSPYSASKAAADHLVNAYHHTYGLHTTVSNCSNNYGPYHFPEKLIPLLITRILHNKALPIYGQGQQIRDWLYVEDHCLGIALILKKGIAGEKYNIGGHNEWKNIDVTLLICDLINKLFASDDRLQQKYPQARAAIEGRAEQLVSYVADRLGHDFRYAINAEKLTAQLKYAPQESFVTGIEKTLRWYLDNEQWWQPLLKK